MTGTAMAKKKSTRSPKNKERQEPGFRTVGFRASQQYVEWLSSMAKLDRLTVAQFIDKAVTERARQLDPTRPPPERIP